MARAIESVKGVAKRRFATPEFVVAKKESWRRAIEYDAALIACLLSERCCCRRKAILVAMQLL